MTILGFDVSHFQPNVNFAAAKAAARAFAALKATEGIGYVDPSFMAYRKAAHAAGLIVGIYHFARDNAPAAEAAYFAGVIGGLQANEFLVLDQEVAHAGGNVPWCAAWLGATRSHYGVSPLIYMNKGSSTGLASGDWTQVAQTYGLWAAIYDNSTTQPTVPYWGSPAMKQYSDAGSVLGVGTCDVDVFYGTAAQLAAYGSPAPTPAPAPIPPPLEDDMPYIIRAAGRSDAILAEGVFLPLVASSDETKNWTAAGAKEVWVMPATWDSYAKLAGTVVSATVDAGAVAKAVAAALPADQAAQTANLVITGLNGARLNTSPA